MKNKLLHDQSSDPVSPLIDVVLNALVATFVLFMIYVALVQPGDCDPVEFLVGDPVEGFYHNSFSHAIPTINGCGELRFKIIEGVLPTGLVLDSIQGLIYGFPEPTSKSFPNNIDEYMLKLTVRDIKDSVDASTDTMNLKLQMSAAYFPYSSYHDTVNFLVADEKLTDGYTGFEYEVVLGAMGGLGPYNWRIKTGHLPEGLRLHQGIISGVPTLPGIFKFEIELTDKSSQLRSTQTRQTFSWTNQKITKSFEMEVHPFKTQFELPPARYGEEYVGFLAINKGYDNLDIAFNKSLFGLKFIPDLGLIHGKPDTSGNFVIRFTVKNDQNKDIIISNNLTILPQKPTFRIPRSLIIAEIGDSINFFVPYVGASEPVQLQVINNNLPNGLNLDGNQISGRVKESGKFVVSFKLIDALGKESVGNIRFDIRQKDTLQIKTRVIPDAIVGSNYEFAFSAAGDNGIFKWQFSGNLPDGLRFGQNGIEGIPQDTGTFNITATAQSNFTNKIVSKSFTFDVICMDSSSVEITTQNIPPVVGNTNYDFNFSAQGGIGKYTWSFEGQLPEGLFYSEEGIKGQAKPVTFEQEWEIRAMVTDLLGSSTEQKRFLLKVIPPPPPPLRIINIRFPICFSNQYYETNLVAYGGWGPYKWEVKGLPDGLVLSDNIISGTSTAEGEYQLTLKVIDTLEQEYTEELMLIITK